MPNEIKQNITSSFKAISDILGMSTQKMLHAVLMFDEISVESHPCWDNKTNRILGVCREHRQDTSLEFTNEDDLQTIWDELQCGKIHLAHEVHVNVSGSLVHRTSLMCHVSGLIGNSWCNRNSKSSAMTLQCMPYPYFWKL